jgi:hypothetical protein
MWIDSQQCRYYSTLQEILKDLQEIFSQINFQDLKTDPSVTLWSTDSNDVWNTNWSINLYNKQNPLTAVPSVFDSVVEKIKTMDGCYQVFLNFVAPGSIIPKHKDNKNLGNIIGPEDECYQSVLAVYIPDIDPTVCGFESGGQIKTYSTGEIVAFDGMVEHWGWNYSSQWRITACVDISTKDYNLTN